MAISLQKGGNVNLSAGGTYSQIASNVVSAKDINITAARNFNKGLRAIYFALAALGWRLDVNRATAADWRRLPGLTAVHVDLLLLWPAVQECNAAGTYCSC